MKRKYEAMENKLFWQVYKLLFTRLPKKEQSMHHKLVYPFPNSLIGAYTFWGQLQFYQDINVHI